MSEGVKRGILILAGGLAILIAGLVYEEVRLGGIGRAPLEVSVPAAAAIGGPFALTDQNGKLRRNTDFAGKLMLVYFGYTYCPDVCPTELQTIGDAMTMLGSVGAAVQPIFITVDPKRDTVPELKSYAANFTPSLVALTGSSDDIAKVAKEYKVYYRPANDGKGDGYTVDHSAIVYLMGRDGKYVAHFGPDTTANAMAAEIRKHL